MKKVIGITALLAVLFFGCKANAVVEPAEEIEQETEQVTEQKTETKTEQKTETKPEVKVPVETSETVETPTETPTETTDEETPTEPTDEEDTPTEPELPEDVIVIAFEDLAEWLQNAEENTADTPYKLKITGLTEENIKYVDNFETLNGLDARQVIQAVSTNSLTYMLRNNETKFVDLENTVLPNIIDMSWMFYYCVNLVIAPNIPETVTILYHTFDGCSSLSEAPDIPNGVTNMKYAFCLTSINVTPFIPSSVTILDYAFARCQNLKTVQNIPSSINSAEAAFQSCTLLESCTIYTSSISIELSRGIFYRCTKLKTFYTTDIEGLKYFLSSLGSVSTNYFPNDIDECTFIQIE